MTTIKINIFDNILTQVTKKNQIMKKNTALHWRESQDMNYTRGKKMGIKLKRLLTCRFEKRGNKKLLKIVKKLEQLGHCANGFQKIQSHSVFINYYIKI